MYIDHNGDTIFAPATIPGTGAISIIRISGPDAIRATAAIVRQGAASDRPADTLPAAGIHTAGQDVVLNQQIM